MKTDAPPAIADVPDDVLDSLRCLGLLEDRSEPRFTPLPGGVSSDIWRVDTGDRVICVKRALARLKVSADWRAPVERNAYEAAWIETAAAVVPEAVPALLAQDAKAGLIAMTYLEPESHPSWKEKLRLGNAETSDAEAVAARVAAIHAATAGREDVAERFASDDIFYAIRLEPYLETVARAHPEAARILREIITRTASTRMALVHGDVSPKNILLGPRGPVFLDAECAWYGDPAFDLAFCLNHLLLKCLWTPQASSKFLDCFDALARTYLAAVDWEAPSGLEGRAAPLLAGLFLARVDGKSPVEYITEEGDKERVRRVARELLRSPATRLAAVRDAWAEELGS